MTEKKIRREAEQTVSLMQEAERLRKEARGTPPGIQRDRLIRRARQCETAANADKWIRSPGLVPPT
jgi:hypothetical protein